jgi:hypothetical protein
MLHITRANIWISTINCWDIFGAPFQYNGAKNPYTSKTNGLNKIYFKHFYLQQPLLGLHELRNRLNSNVALRGRYSRISGNEDGSDRLCQVSHFLFAGQRQQRPLTAAGSARSKARTAPAPPGFRRPRAHGRAVLGSRRRRRNAPMPSPCRRTGEGRAPR